MHAHTRAHTRAHTHAHTHTHTHTHNFGLGVLLTLMELYEIFKHLCLHRVCLCACVCVTSAGLCVMTNVWEPTRPSDWVISQSIVPWSVCACMCSCVHVCVCNNSLQGIRTVHSALYNLKKSGKSTLLLWRIILWLFIIAFELERLWALWKGN